MRVPHSRLGQFCFFFATQGISYALIVANGRAYTQGLYLPTITTDGLIAAQGFIIIRLIAKDENAGGAWCFAGTVLGGMTGSLISIFITKMVYGR